jgi:subtilisin family serine protease
MRGNTTHNFPFILESAQLDLAGIERIKRSADVEDVIPEIPFQKPKPLAHGARPVAESDVIDGAGWGLHAIGAMSAANDGRDVTVAVLDTGIDASHPAFAGLELAVKDFTVGDAGSAGGAPDLDGHGTRVAAAIFGRDVEGIRIGVAPGIGKALVGKVMPPEGANLVALKSGLDWALNEGADIVCLSLGIDYPGLVERYHDAFGVPLDIATSRVFEAYRRTMRLFDTYAAHVKARTLDKGGAILIAASGNESRRDENPGYFVNTSPPAASDDFVAIGAISRGEGGQLHLSPFSNRDCQFVAPGDSIVSAKANGGLCTDTGTSMAAPYAAGVCALWLSMRHGKARPAKWADDLDLLLKRYAKPIAGASSDIGAGLVYAPQLGGDHDACG